MHRVRVVRSAGLLPLLGVLVVACLWALPAHAEDQTVRVTDGGFDPDRLEVVVGDTITWRWANENENRHGVRVDAVAGPAAEGAEGPAYQSHPECTPQTTGKCGGPGTTRYWSPELAGTYRFYCPLHGTALLGMNGTLTVEAAPSPAPSETTSPSGDPSPSQSPKQKSGDPTPSPTPEPQQRSETGSSAGDDGATDNGSTTSSSDAPRPRRTQGTASSPGISYGPPEPVEPEPLPTILPSVAPSETTTTDVSDPDLEAFPEEPSSSASEDGAGVIALDTPRGPSPRSVWLGIGSASILASAGAFLKLVLFGAPWS